MPPVPLGDADGEDEGEDDGEVDGLGVGDELSVGVGVPLSTTPVHVVPLRVKTAGTGLLPFQLPLNPKLVFPPVPIEPL